MARLADIDSVASRLATEVIFCWLAATSRQIQWLFQLPLKQKDYDAGIYDTILRWLPRARRRLGLVGGTLRRNRKEPIYRASSSGPRSWPVRWSRARPKGAAGWTNGRRLFIDGDARLKVSRPFRDVLASIATDLGGVDRLSEGQKQIARRCAMLSVRCEIMESAAVAGQPFDLDAYGQLTDRLGRAFQRLGLRRVMHDVTPDLGTYLNCYVRREAPGWRRRDRRLQYGIRNRNGRQRPTSSIGERDANSANLLNCLPEGVQRKGCPSLCARVRPTHRWKFLPSLPSRSPRSN